MANSVRVPLVALIALPLAAAGAIGWGLAGTLWVAAVKILVT